MSEKIERKVGDSWYEAISSINTEVRVFRTARGDITITRKFVYLSDKFKGERLVAKTVESAFHHVGIAPCKPAVIPIVEF